MKVTVPEELFRAKKSGALLPFFGAGVSAALGVPSWSGLLKQISENINCPDALRERVLALDYNTDFEELSAVASELLKASGDEKVFMGFLQESLRPKVKGDTPERFKAVAELRDDLPGIVTTNFDTVLEEYCNVPKEDVIYRNYEDLMKQLQQKKFLFKIHGDPTQSNLLVFTKQQYDELENDSGYQDAFKQVFLQWAIIFVGYSITDSYILNNLEYLHRNFADELEVFALLPEAEFELQKRLRRIGVKVIPYAKGEGAARHASVDAFLALLDSKDFIPAPESGFQGRAEEIDKISKGLTETNSVLIEILGPAGIGKTQLARAAAQNIRQEGGKFSTSIFVDLIDKEGPSPLIFGIRDALGLSESITEESEIYKLAASRKALIIADNLEDPLREEGDLKEQFVDSLVNLCLALKDYGALIITSRTTLPENIASRIGDIHTINLGPLKYNESRELFILESNAASISEDGEKVLQRLSSNPGSIRILGRRATKLSDEGKENLFKNLLEDPEKASDSVLKTTLELLPEDSQQALQVALAFPAGLSMEVARFLIGNNFTELLSHGLHHGLIIRSGGRYRATESIRQALSLPEEAENILLKAIEFYTEEINKFERERQKGIMKPSNATFLLEEYGNISASASTAEKKDHQKLSDITTAICKFFNWSGFLEDSTKWIRTVYWSESIKTYKVQMLILFGNTLARFGNPENNKLAERIYRRILSHFEKLEAEGTELDNTDRVRVIDTSESLAFLLMNIGGKGNSDEAESLLRKTLSMKKKFLPNNTQSIAKTSNLLAHLLLNYQGEENLREAEIYIRDAYEQIKQIAEKDHRSRFEYVNSMRSLAHLLQRLGKPEDINEIEALNKEVLEITRELSSSIPGAKEMLASSLGEYAHFLTVVRRADKLEEIEGMYREALKIQRELAKTQPNLRRHLAQTLYSLSVFLRMRGKDEFLKEAEALQVESLSIIRDIAETMPSALPNLAMTLNQIATFIKDYQDKDRLLEGESLLREALTIAFKVEEMGLEASQLKVKNLMDLAALLKLIGGEERLQEAEKILHQILEIFKDEAQHLPRARFSIASVNLILADLKIKKKDEYSRVEAMELYKEAIKIQEKAMENPHLNLSLAMTKLNYANFLTQLAKPELYGEVQKIFQDALTTIKSISDLNPNSIPKLRGPKAHILLQYGRFIVSLGGIQNFQLAENLLNEALEIKRELAKEYKQELLGLADTLSSIGSIVKMMGGINNLTKAENYLREALSIKKELMKKSRGIKLDISEITTNLAQTLLSIQGLERFAEAESLLKETVILNREEAKRDPRAALNLARTLGILASALSNYSDIEKLKESESAFKESISIFREWAKRIPRVYEDLMVNLLNLSNLLIKIGDSTKFTEIEQNLLDALKIADEFLSKTPNFGIRQYQIKLALIDLYFRLENKEKLIQAEQLCREALNFLKSLISGRHENAIMDVSIKLADILLILSGNQRINEVERIYREAIAYAKTHENNSAQYHLSLARLELGLGKITAIPGQKDKIDEAEALLNSSVNRYRQLAQSVPEASIDLNKSLAYLADFYIQYGTQDKLFQAEILFREVLNVMRARPDLLGLREQEIIGTMSRMIEALQRIGGLEKLLEAESLSKELIEKVKKMATKQADMKQYLPNLLFRLGQIYELLIKQGKKEKIYELEPTIEEAINYSKELAKHNPGFILGIADTYFFLAANLNFYGPPEKYDKSATLYNQAMDIYREQDQTKPSIMEKMVRTAAQLAGLLDKMEDPNKLMDIEMSYRGGLMIARELAEVNTPSYVTLGQLTFNFANFLRKHKADSAQEEIKELYQEAKDSYRKIGKEEYARQVEETEKKDSI